MQNVSQVTVDEFFKLTPADHSVAINTYSQAITKLEKTLAQPCQTEARDNAQDELSRSLTLRKVHVAALAEQLEISLERAVA